MKPQFSNDLFLLELIFFGISYTLRFLLFISDIINMPLNETVDPRAQHIRFINELKSSASKHSTGTTILDFLHLYSRYLFSWNGIKWQKCWMRFRHLNFSNSSYGRNYLMSFFEQIQSSKSDVNIFLVLAQLRAIRNKNVTILQIRKHLYKGFLIYNFHLLKW